MDDPPHGRNGTDVKKHIVIVPNSNEERRRSLKTFRRSLKTFRGSLNRHLGVWGKQWFKMLDKIPHLLLCVLRCKGSAKVA